MEQEIKPRKARRKQPRRQPLPALRYLNAWLSVDPETGAIYTLRETKTAKVGDRIDYPTARGYRKISFTYYGKCRTLPAHRVAWALYHQTIPPVDMDIDHINHTRDLNSRDNLQLLTPLLNQQRKVR